jgi:hypothetical protein
VGKTNNKLANMLNSRVRVVHNANDLHMKNAAGKTGDTHRGERSVKEDMKYQRSVFSAVPLSGLL